MEPKPKRPLFVTLLAVVVFSLSATSFAGFAVGLARWQIYANWDLSLPLWLPIALGGVWGLVWLVIGWGLWRLLAWARRTTIVCLVVYQVMVIGQQGLFAQGDYERGRLPLVIGMAILLTALVIVGLMHPRVRQVFENSRNHVPGSSM